MASEKPADAQAVVQGVCQFRRYACLDIDSDGGAPVDTLDNNTTSIGRLMEDELPPTVSIEEAARLCGVSRSAAYRAVHRGQLTAFRVGRKLRVPTLPLLRLLGVATDDGSEPA